MTRTDSSLRGAWPLLLLTASCTGAIPAQAPAGGEAPDRGMTGADRPGSPAGMTTVPGAKGSAPACTPKARAPLPLRRLTRWEYDNTVADLLGDTSGPARAFAPEGRSTGFDTAADGATLNDAVVEQTLAAAARLATSATGNLATLLGCDVQARGEDDCARRFITSFGRRAFRRALTGDELARYESFYKAAKATGGFGRAIELTVRAFLVSPHFLYKVELGGEDPRSTRLAPHELATRLSYLVTGTAPREELLTLAESGGLATADQVREQARKMLAAEEGGRVLRRFYGQWLGVDDLAGLTRGPEFTPALALSMRDEVETYFERLIRDRDAPFRELMTSRTSYANPALAQVYGLDGVTGTALRAVERQPDRHRGFLTQPAFAALHAFPNDSSPIHRGVFLRVRLLCEAPLTPPPNIDATLPPADASKTARQQLEDKTERVDPCRACHTAINPPGYAFDRFDQIGRHRQVDRRGRPYDTAGELRGTDVDGQFSGQVELIEKLAGSGRAMACMATQWARYVNGRLEDADDDCRTRQLAAAFAASGGSVKALLLELVSSEEFLHR